MNDADFYIGKPIRSLQTMLRVIAAADEAIPQVVPDGIYGPDTEAAGDGVSGPFRPAADRRGRSGDVEPGRGTHI